jgi:hypothetical protein
VFGRSPLEPALPTYVVIDILGVGLIATIKCLTAFFVLITQPPDVERDLRCPTLSSGVSLILLPKDLVSY